MIKELFDNATAKGRIATVFLVLAIIIFAAIWSATSITFALINILAFALIASTHCLLIKYINGDFNK